MLRIYRDARERLAHLPSHWWAALALGGLLLLFFLTLLFQPTVGRGGR